MYLYYGNQNATNQQNATGVWDSNYRFVLHLNSTGATVYDSTSNGINGTKRTATQPSGNGSLIGSAQNFSSSNPDMINITDATNPTAYTISLWITPATNADQGFFARTDTSGPTGSWSHELRGTGTTIQHYTYDGAAHTISSTTNIVAGNTYYLVATAQNGGSARLYVNGLEEGTAANGITTLRTGGDRYALGRADGSGNANYLGVWASPSQIWVVGAGGVIITK